MFVRFEISKPKILAGIRMKMNFTNHNPGLLWRNFMPRRNEITNRTGNEFYSCEVFGKGHFQTFDPNREFEKWAAVSVTSASPLPNGMEILEIPEGEYAVFLHKGSNTEAAKTYGYIFREWLPASGYKVDDRPHFAVMGDKYKNDDPSSEEEICIPVKKKN